MSVYIQTGKTEPIEVLALNVLGERLTGKTDIYCKIRRQSDNLYFDWSDNLFKANPTTLRYAMIEIDSDKAAGEYKLTKTGHVNGFNTATIANADADDIYAITVEQVGGTDAINLPQIGELKVGHYTDDIPSFNSNEIAEIKDVLGISGTGTPVMPTEGPLAIILGLVQHNFVLDNTQYNASGLMTAGRVRIFPNKATALAATDGGTGEGELASFTVTASAEMPPHSALPVIYRSIREA